MAKPNPFASRINEAPDGENSEYIGAYLPQRMLEEIDLLVLSMGTSKSNVIRRMVTNFLESEDYDSETAIAALTQQLELDWKARINARHQYKDWKGKRLYTRLNEYRKELIAALKKRGIYSRLTMEVIDRFIKTEKERIDAAAKN